MIQWRHSPSADIARYIDCYWHIEKTADAQTPSHPKLNPDPAAHLLLAPPTQAFSYSLDDSPMSGQGSHWLYPNTRSLELDHSQPFVLLGVKFRVGALYALSLKDYHHPSLDQVAQAQLEDIMPETHVTHLLKLAQTDAQACVSELDKQLTPWLMQSREDKHSQLVHKAINTLNDHPISQLGSVLACSQRTLERSFSRVTGITLKQCQTMNKLEAILEYLYQREKQDIDWAQIALEFGFSDQPHLIRRLKEYMGVTPAHYAAHRGFTIDAYGGVE